MGLPVTSGDPFGDETLDRTVSRGSLFTSEAVEEVGLVCMILPPEFTENRHRVPEWCRPQLRSFGSTLGGYSTASGKSPVSIFWFC